MGTANGKMLKGLFDRPIVQQNAVGALYSGYQPGSTDPADPGIEYAPCGPDYYMDVSGLCVHVTTFIPSEPYSGNPYPVESAPTSSSASQYDYQSNVPVTVVVNNNTQIADATVDAVAEAINNAIAANTQIIKDQSAAVENAITKEIQEDTDSITNGIRAAQTNLGDEVKVTTTALAATTAATVGTVAASISDEITAVKSAITPILTSISGFVHDINVEVQSINDTFIQPLVSLYNSTIGTIASLTQAIEADLKDGISGLLQLPNQLATQLGSFDASLQRTVEQLGSVNKETVTVGIDYLGKAFPKPFSDALNTSLSGKSLSNSLASTYGDKVSLSSESFKQVSAEAIQGLGKLLTELLTTTTETFKDSYEGMHANWSSVGGVFVELLNGALSLLTTLTAIGALAGPLIEAAEEEAHKLIPITKLDPATVIEALKRGFIDTTVAMDELRTKGIDATRSKVLVDLSVFLADANMALDWWYRGIIADDDLIANLRAHGFETEDITAYKQGSVNLPTLPDMLRWMNFGIITQEQFEQNARILRYNDTQITAMLATYQERESAQTLAQLDGLLNVSNSGWLNQSLRQAVPETVQTAGRRGGLHPDLVDYIWLSHWKLPDTLTFMQLYFRGLRTLTELQQRMQVDNIPPELWDDLIQANRSLIPYRSIPSYVSKGYMTHAQADKELEGHGFDLAHRQIILKAIKEPVDTTTATAVQAVHTLSVGNAKSLWESGALSDLQYETILIAHGYDAPTAALQVKADKVTQHIHQQKQELADVTNQVESGTMTMDDATAQLQRDGFTQGQISKFAVQIAKYGKTNAKIPGLSELNKFLKAELITLDQYKQALTDSGWGEPWLTAFLGLVTPAADTTTPTTAV